ncbi:hypothetical protein BC829DRAFT_184989 [Chytridium lagenaria]|nr:hypothetical protein BC829DRAFT_184989 [Chytridium lagenaria]
MFLCLVDLEPPLFPRSHRHALPCMDPFIPTSPINGVTIPTLTAESPMTSSPQATSPLSSTAIAGIGASLTIVLIASAVIAFTIIRRHRRHHRHLPPSISKDDILLTPTTPPSKERLSGASDQGYMETGKTRTSSPERVAGYPIMASTAVPTVTHALPDETMYRDISPYGYAHQTPHPQLSPHTIPSPTFKPRIPPLARNPQT